MAVEFPPAAPAVLLAGPAAAQGSGAPGLPDRVREWNSKVLETMTRMGTPLSQGVKREALRAFSARAGADVNFQNHTKVFLTFTRAGRCGYAGLANPGCHWLRSDDEVAALARLGKQSIFKGSHA